MKRPFAYEYMNRETGEILTYDAMIKQGDEVYDINDPTNNLTYSDYYMIIKRSFTDTETGEIFEEIF